MLLHQNINKSEARARVLEMLNLVQIAEADRRLDEYPHQLSGGMRQRVMIAMALACNPKVLIADEPTTALDVTIQAQILNLMLELKERLGTAIIMITHDLGVVAETAQKVVVMYAGRKVEQAPVGDLFEHPLHPYTRGIDAVDPQYQQGSGRAIRASSFTKSRAWCRTFAIRFQVARSPSVVTWPSRDAARVIRRSPSIAPDTSRPAGAPTNC